MLWWYRKPNFVECDPVMYETAPWKMFVVPVCPDQFAER